MKLKTLSASVALALGVSMGSAAMAGPTFFGSAGTLFEDDLLDYHIDRNSNGKIDVGDSIIAIFSVRTTARVNPAGPSIVIAPPEFTGIIDQYVSAVIPLIDAFGNPIKGPAKLGFPTGAPLFNFVFSPNPGGFLDADGSFGGAPITGAVVAAAGAPPGTMVRMWDGPIADMDLAGADCNTGLGGSQASLVTCLTGASNGTLFWNAGITAPGGNEHIVVASASDNPLYVRTFGATAVVGTPGFAFEQLAGGVGPTVSPQVCDGAFCPLTFAGPMVDVEGSGTVQGGIGLPGTGVGGAYVSGVDPFARGDFQFEVYTTPEPGILALFGLSLAGIGAATRRRKVVA